jgi:hypothetical protein
MSSAGLEVAARAALANSLPIDPHQKVFMPFGIFCWPGAPLPGAPKPLPVGATPEEARCVAWILTASVHMDAYEALKVANHLAYAAKLSRDAIITDSIYTELAAASLAPGGPRRGLVRIADVERVLGVHWNDSVVDVGGIMQRVDPYFWTMIDLQVRRSIEEHVWALERKLSSLPGLASDQESPAATTATDAACRVVIQRMTPVILSRKSSVSSITAIVNQLAMDLLPGAVSNAKRAVQSDMAGIRALSILAATDPESLEERMQELEGALAALVDAPPHPLADQFANRKLGFHELQAAFPLASRTVLNASRVPPTSLGVRTSILACWLQSYGPAVQEACVAAMASLQRASQRPQLLAAWSDVNLCEATGTALQTPWPAPSYATSPCAQPARVLTVHSSDGVALRVARLLSVLLQEAQMALLPVGAVHQSLVAPVIARVRAEREVALGACISRNLRPVAERVGVSWPDESAKEAAGALPVPSVVQTEPVTTLTPAPTLAPVPASVAAVGPACMPASLLRDHSILTALFQSLQQRRGHHSIHVALNEIVSRARSLSDVLRSQTEASLVQSTRWVCTKVVDRALAQLQEARGNGSISYQVGRNHEAGVRAGGIVAEGDGASALVDYVHGVLVQMQTDGFRFATVWHASRSARSRAGLAIGKRVRGSVVAAPSGRCAAAGELFR